MLDSLSDIDPERTIEFEFVRATENAALNVLPWLGRGEKEKADAAACDEIACVVLIVTASSLPPRHPFAALSSFQIPPGLPVPRKARHSIELSMFASVTTFDPQEFNQWR